MAVGCPKSAAAGESELREVCFPVARYSKTADL